MKINTRLLVFAAIAIGVWWFYFRETAQVYWLGVKIGNKGKWIGRTKYSKELHKSYADVLGMEPATEEQVAATLGNYIGYVYTDKKDNRYERKLLPGTGSAGPFNGLYMFGKKPSDAVVATLPRFAGNAGVSGMAYDGSTDESRRYAPQFIVEPNEYILHAVKTE